MLLVANLQIALKALRVHRLRSTLTMLGIIIGVGAVVAMVAIGSGAQERVAAQIRSLGANLIMVTPGSITTGGARLGSGGTPRLNEDDAYAIEADAPGVVAVAPILTLRAQFAIGPTNWSGQVKGVSIGYFDAREWGIGSGRAMTPEDVEGAAKVVLLGETVRQNLFGDEDPVGAVIRIREKPFTVIGVLERKGQSVQGDDQDDTVLIPISTARRQLIGGNRASPRFIYYMFVKFANDRAPEEVMDGIAAVMRQRHRVQPGQEDTFILRNLAEVAETQQAASRVLTALLAAVASVSLLVGGIGIMNIMLVSVTERTREIGLRMAVGARGRDILAQFLTEAVTLCLIGGLIGVAVGVGASYLIASLAGWHVFIEAGTVMLAVTFSGAIGVFFGYYPARKAARLDPIVALRYE